MNQTINLSLSQGLVTAVDQIARKQGASRSELLRESLRALVLRTRLLEEAYAIGARKAKQLKLKSDEDVWAFLEE